MNLSFIVLGVTMMAVFVFRDLAGTRRRLVLQA